MSNVKIDGRDQAAVEALTKAEDHTLQVRNRSNIAKGIVSHGTAGRLVKIGVAIQPDPKTLVLAEGWEDSIPQPEPDTGEPEVITPEEPPAEPTEAKVNGRKAKADKSPYSTAPVAGRIKRHGKSRRTGTDTEIEDGLHKDATFKIKGPGRYRVKCLTHKQHMDVPDMTTAKPLQARTDEFCQKCVQAVADRAAATKTEATKASA